MFAEASWVKIRRPSRNQSFCLGELTLSWSWLQDNHLVLIMTSRQPPPAQKKLWFSSATILASQTKSDFDDALCRLRSKAQRSSQQGSSSMYVCMCLCMYISVYVCWGQLGQDTTTKQKPKLLSGRVDLVLIMTSRQPPCLDHDFKTTTTCPKKTLVFKCHHLGKSD